MQAAIKALVPSTSVAASSAAKTPFAINPASLPHTELVRLDTKPNSGLLTQSAAGQGDFVVLQDKTGNGIATLVASNELEYVPAQCMRAKDGTFVLSNESLEVKISNKGRITSIYDLREQYGTSSLRPNRFADRLVVTGVSWSHLDALAALSSSKTFPEDSMLVSAALCNLRIGLTVRAGDVDVWHLETAEQLEAASVKSDLPGPLRASVVLEYKVGKSTCKVSCSLEVHNVAQDAELALADHRLARCHCG